MSDGKIISAVEVCDMQAKSSPAQLEYMRKDRRFLHRIPEIGFELPKTRSYVGSALQEVHPDELYECAGGWKAVFRARNPIEDAIAFRADMDALPVAERTGLPFASEHSGAMHACGHDGHTAILLGLARMVSQMRENLRRDIVLIFQPAEENIGGAVQMIKAGVLENPKVSEIYALHLWPGIPKGRFGVGVGPVMSGVASVDITVRGTSTHGAMPHMGADPVCAVAQAILSIQASLMRTVNAADPVVFTVGKLQGGTMRNILAEELLLECTIRAFSTANMEKILDTARAALAGADALYGTQSKLEVLSSDPPVVNDERAVARVRAAAWESAQPFVPVSIAEDFSEYQRICPGAFIFCGVGDTQPLHSAEFNFDEESLVDGLNLLENILWEANDNVGTV